MFELGTSSEIEHQQIVDYIKQNPFDETYIIGKNFFKKDVNGCNIKKFEGFDDLKDELQKHPIENKFMLIKGSRGMALERILEIL